MGGREVSRKAIHVAVSIAAAGMVWQLPIEVTRPLFAGAFLVALLVDVLRRRIAGLGRLFERAFGAMLRTRESMRLTGATTLAAGFAIAVVVFPPRIATVGILIAGLADAAAALVGRRYGRHRNRNGKSLEGSLACFATALILAWVTPDVDFAGAFMLALGLTVLEAAPLPVDDNLVLPIVAAVLYWAAALPLV